MPEKNTETFTYKLTIDDLIDNSNNKHNCSNSIINYIPKNQKEFGHKKRIKP